MPHSADCTRGWQGGRKCHCVGCCQNFSTPANFDRHRRDGKCLTPTDAGLIPNKRGVFITPGEADLDVRFGR